MQNKMNNNEQINLGNLYRAKLNFYYVLEKPGFENGTTMHCFESKQNKSSDFILVDAMKDHKLFWFIFLGPGGKKFCVHFPKEKSYIDSEYPGAQVRFNQMFVKIK